MQKVCYIFLSVVNKNVKKPFYALTISLLFLATLSLASELPTSTSSPTPDLTSVPQLALQEATKNAAKNYQIGDRINLLAEIKASGLENGAHLSLKLPEGSSKLEDQGWYIDPSSQYLNGSFHFIASPIQTGSLTLPTLLVVNDDGLTLGRTSPYSVQVTGPEKKDNAKAELLEITQSSLPGKYWVLLMAFILAIVAGGAYGVSRYLKTRRKKPTSIPQPVVEADHVIAFRKINNLYQTYSYDLENLKPLSFGISETLKEFFSRRFNIDATEATSDEMLELLRREAITGENLREIQILFQDLDLVKFTKTENYSHFDALKYQEIKVKSQLIVQKWTLQTKPQGPTS